MFLLRVFIHVINCEHQIRSWPERLSKLYSSGKGVGQEEVKSDDSMSEEVAISARYMESYNHIMYRIRQVFLWAKD